MTSDDEEILAKASMPTVASIVYEKENYMAWLMEQLNFTKEEQQKSLIEAIFKLLATKMKKYTINGLTNVFLCIKLYI